MAGVDKIVTELRRRTSDEWWLHAYDVLTACDEPSTGGPLGLGVDFFADDHGLLIDDDARHAIADDAYEAAREVILDGISAHVTAVAPAVRACAGTEHDRASASDRLRPKAAE